MRASSLSAILILIPLMSMADEHASALLRMEESTEKMTGNLLAFYESRVPELANVRPDMAWDAEFRKAGQCFLEGLNANGGAAAVSIYLVALATYAAVEFENFTDITSTPPPALATNIVLELSQVCGLISLGSEKMAASGLTEAFAKEGVLTRIMSPAE